ncbi:MAG: methyltransferase domain-containing protein [Candidatus Nanopelagicales bacterium]
MDGAGGRRRRARPRRRHGQAHRGRPRPRRAHHGRRAGRRDARRAGPRAAGRARPARQRRGDPLGDASVDAVVVGQAWHWVDPVRAVPEVARVLRPGGVLGLVWNLRDEDVPWVGELGALLGGVEGKVRDVDDPPVGHPFPPLEENAFRWSSTLTREQVLDMVASRSYVITLDAEPRAALLDGVRRLLDEHPDLRGRDEVELPYVTRAFRTALPT